MLNLLFYLIKFIGNKSISIGTSHLNSIKMKLAQIITIILFNIFFSSALAEQVPIPAAPSIGAKAYILKDVDSGEVISEHHADAQIEPASITKIMTAYVVFEELATGRLSLDETAEISVKAWRNPGVSGWIKGSRMFAEVESKVSIADLLRGLIVQSGNDAAIALAEHVAGSEDAFVKLMNDAADSLGLQNTHYKNTTGWPVSGHYTSARDVALLSQALITNFPEMYGLYSEKSFTYNNISQSNRNRLLWKDESVDGIKTGHTRSAGYCLAASAQRGGMRLIAVVMGASSADRRIKYSQSLLNYGFRFYETHQLFVAGESLKTIRIWQGVEEQLGVGISKDMYVTIPRGQYNSLKPVLNIRKTVNAPVTEGDSIGSVEIFLDQKLIQQRSLHALNSIDRGNVFQRIIDKVIYLLQ